MNPLFTLKALRKLQRLPNIFIREILKSILDENQKRIVKAIMEYDRVAAASCHSIGKTYTSARIALSFLFSYPFSLVLTTAPTDRQVRMLLWGEIQKAYRNAAIPLGGKLRAGSGLDIVPKEWYGVGFSPQKSARPKSMLDNTEQQKVVVQGWHGDFILVIIDEAVGIDADVWTQIEGLLTSGKVVKILAIGNPTTKNCIFYNLFDSPSWYSMHITCFETQNMIANGFTSIEKLEAECARLLELEKNERVLEIKKYKRQV